MRLRSSATSPLNRLLVPDTGWILAQERVTSGRRPFVYEHFSTPAILQNYRGDLYQAMETEWLTRMVESKAG